MSEVNNARQALYEAKERLAQASTLLDRAIGYMRDGGGRVLVEDAAPFQSDRQESVAASAPTQSPEIGPVEDDGC